MRVLTALFRPDAIAGHGHLSRSLALATAWARTGGAVVVDAPGIDDAWLARYEAIGTVWTGQRCDWCVLDGYGNTVDVQRAARAEHDHVLVIDDHGSLGRYDADLVLDHNIGATSGDLRGIRYLLLRPEFRAEPPTRTGGHVLLAPGGAPSADTAAQFEAAASALAGLDVVWLRGVDDVVATMAAADVAIAAAGVTAYELARVGVPAVLVAVADNQRPVARRLAEAGAAVFVDGSQMAEAALDLLADAARRDEMSRTARALVDGRGADRVVAAMRSVSIDLRPATDDDAELTWRWANDPEVRRQSFSSAPIPWEAHRAWFADRPADYVIAEVDGVPVGQVRFAGDPVAEVGYLLDADARGRGLAAPLLVAACRWFRAAHPDTDVVARVKPDNAASIAALDLAGFEPMEPEGTALRYRLPATT